MDPRPALPPRPASSSHRARRRAPLLALALLATFVVTAPIAASPAGALSIPGKTVPTTTVARGSVEQIYVLNAPDLTTVTATSTTSSATGTTDDDGALLLRDVDPGTYTVTIHSTPVSTFTGVVVDSSDTAQQTIYDNLGTPAPRPVVAKTMKLVADQPVDDFIEVSDGTLLDYRVDLPFARPNGTHRFDVAVLYSGYRAGLRPSESWEQAQIDLLLLEGFAVVSVSMRGTGCSGGAFDVMEELVGRDGYDAIATINAQPWVDEVAMVGNSWLGLSQLFVAQHFPPSSPPILDAIAPGATVTDFYRDVVYPGGILNDGFATSWASGRDSTNAAPSSYTGAQALPVETTTVPAAPTDCGRNQALRNQNVNTVATWVGHDTYDEYWQERTVDLGAISTPTLVVNSWADEQTASRPAAMLDQFDHPSARVRMIATPAGHAAYATNDVWDEVVTFLRVYLDASAPVSRTAYEGRSKVEVFLEQEGYLDPADRAVPRARLHLPAFDSDDPDDRRRFAIGADLQPEIGGSATSSYFAQPANPKWEEPVGQDNVAFTSPALVDQVVMAGSASVDLRIRADNDEADLQATLIEVRPDGKEMLIQSGWLRASHAKEATETDPNPIGRDLRPYHSHLATDVVPLVPGEWTDVRLELLPFAHVFRPGSRIKLVVDAPGGQGQYLMWAFPGAVGGFDVTIAHGPGESSILLPVLDDPTITGPASGDTVEAPMPASLSPCGFWGWQPCRAAPTISALAGSVSDTNLVTLTATSSGAASGIAGVSGPRTAASGGVGDGGLVGANGSTSFRAPPGRHRYTFGVTNSVGVQVTRTVEVDVPGFAGPDPLTLPAPPSAPVTVTWGPPGTSWWTSIDGQGLHGWTALTTPQVSIPANKLGTGTHVVRLSGCDALGCTNHFKPITYVAGTVTYLAPVGTPSNPFGGKALSGIRDSTSLIAIIQPASGPAVRIYSPHAGIMGTSPLQVGDAVTAGQELGLVAMIDTPESLTIQVGPTPRPAGRAMPRPTSRGLDEAPARSSLRPAPRSRRPCRGRGSAGCARRRPGCPS